TDVLDCTYEEPHKKGMIAIKPSQVGWSLAMIILMACRIDTCPGPMLYLTTDATKAGTFTEKYLMPIIKGIPRLRMNLERAAKELSEQKTSKPFEGGYLDLVGAGSESGVISLPRRDVWLDEYQLSAENFPGSSGDLWKTALGR